MKFCIVLHTFTEFFGQKQVLSCQKVIYHHHKTHLFLCFLIILCFPAKFSAWIDVARREYRSTFLIMSLLEVNNNNSASIISAPAMWFHTCYMGEHLNRNGSYNECGFPVILLRCDMRLLMTSSFPTDWNWTK